MASPSSAPVVRPARISDADAIGAMHLASWVETYTGLADASFWERATVERSTASWRRLLDAGHGAILAEIDGQVVGIAAVDESSARDGVPPLRRRELTNLYVLQALHGTGLGQSLLDAVLPHRAAAQLWVAHGNPRARRFYERNGFAADGAENDGSVFGGIAALRMVR